MASVEKRTKQGRDVWLVRWRTPDGQQRSKQFDRAVDARKHRTNIERALDRGEYVDKRAGNITLGEWWDEWWPTQTHLARSTLDRDTRTFANHVRPKFGSTAINKITRQSVMAWVAELTKSGLAAETVMKCVQVLSKALRAAVEDGRLLVNVADRISNLPRKEHREPKPLTRVELDRLAAAMPDEYRPFVWLGGYLGLRAAEIAGLEWDAVDLDTGWVTVRQQATDVAGKLEVTTRLKSKAAYRKVPIPEWLREELRAYRDEATSWFVLNGERGAVLRTNNFRNRIFKPAVDRADLPSWVTPHTLRRTAASMWARAGATPSEIRIWLGHSSAATVFNIYEGQHEEHAHEVVNRLS